LKTALVRRVPVWRAHWVVPLVPVLFVPISAVAQSSYGQRNADAYKSGPTRPLDNSPRGVYSAKAAPSYAHSPRDEPAPLGYGSAAPASPPIWQGLYAGLQSGYRWTNTDAAGSGLPALSNRGAQFGAHMGLNYQINDFVLGVEGDLMLGNSTASTTSLGTTLALKESWTSTLRGRVGYSFGPALLYATGGLALAGQDLSLLTSTLATTMTDTRVGLVGGLGLEMRLTQQLSARIEGLRYSYRDSILNLGTSNLPVKQDSNVVRGGLSYRFN
jgi:outer membrane immunogenic protein